MIRAAVALVLATPVATWFLVGDLSATQYEDLDSPRPGTPGARAGGRSG